MTMRPLGYYHQDKLFHSTKDGVGDAPEAHSSDDTQVTTSPDRERKLLTEVDGTSRP